MHFLGLFGMPRRIPDYPEAFWGWLVMDLIYLTEVSYYFFYSFCIICMDFRTKSFLFRFSSHHIKYDVTICLVIFYGG
jgi:heme/copper-type cytochrome/quinol oxidase subunit 1